MKRKSSIFTAALVTLLPLGPLRGQQSEVIATVAGTPITVADLDRAVGNRLIKVETEAYKIRRAALDELINAAILKQAAQQAKTTSDLLVKGAVSTAVHQPTTEEARIAYEATHLSDTAPPSEEVLQRTISLMTSRREKAARAAYIASLRQDTPVKILLKAPRAQFEPSDSPSRGPVTAKVKMVEFSDFQCPFCRVASKTVEELRAAYGDRLQIVFRNYPLAMHPQAEGAAEAAMCAYTQGKFWEMHDLFFANQSALTAPDFLRYAAKAGLDIAPFTACVEEHGSIGPVMNDRVAAGKAGVTGTPAFFINGRMITGAATFKEFATVIDEELGSTAGQ